MVRGGVGSKPRYLGSSMVNTVLFQQVEKKFSEPGPLKSGDVQVEQEELRRQPVHGPLLGQPALVPWSSGEELSTKSLKDGCETYIQKIEEGKKSCPWVEQIGEDEALAAGTSSQSPPRMQSPSGSPLGARTVTSLPLSWAGAAMCTQSSSRATVL